ncbi:MAG: hypothetical protein WCS89_02410 [Candidatus Paceibacterota bacterium]|jgi:hypothetical protein
MNKPELEKQLRFIKEAVNQCLLSIDTLEEDEVSGNDGVMEKSVSLSTEGVDFSMQSRAFFKKYAKGMSGTKVFVLMIAYFVNKNKVDTVSYSDIQKEWSKMTVIIKHKPSTTFAVRAKESDWISSPKNSLYSLRPTWKDIFNNNGKNS